MLSIRKLGKHFGGLTVLENVSFDVPLGGIFGLIGPNGAGKTTVFNLITGLLKPSTGTVSFEDRDLPNLAKAAADVRGEAPRANVPKLGKGGKTAAA